MIVFLLSAALTTPPAQAKTCLFTASTVNETVHGELAELGDAWAVRIGTTKIQPGELVALQRKNAILPAITAKNVLILSNGDRIALDANAPPELRDDRLFFRPARPLQFAKGTASVSVSVVSLLWFVPSERDNDPLFSLRRLHTAPRARDWILLRNGDRLEGTIATFSADQGVRASVNQRDAIVKPDKLTALAFNKELQAKLRPAGVFAHLVLADGTRLGVSELRLADGRLEGKTLLGAECSVPLASLVSLQVRGARAVYLSDLPVLRHEHEPFLGISWPFLKDASVAGRDLLVAGSVYDKGIGMHAGSRVTFDLKGQYRWFGALVGMDGATGKRGRARFAVEVDGKPIATSQAKELTAFEPPRAVRVDVLNARTLTLIADFSETFGNVQGHVNWVDARLIK